MYVNIKGNSISTSIIPYELKSNQGYSLYFWTDKMYIYGYVQRCDMTARIFKHEVQPIFSKELFNKLFNADINRYEMIVPLIDEINKHYDFIKTILLELTDISSYDKKEAMNETFNIDPQLYKDDNCVHYYSDRVYYYSNSKQLYLSHNHLVGEVDIDENEIIRYLAYVDWKVGQIIKAYQPISHIKAVTNNTSQI